MRARVVKVDALGFTNSIDDFIQYTDDGKQP